MASQSPEQFPPFTGVNRFRFDQNRGDGPGTCVFDSLGALSYFLACRESLKRRGGVLAISEVDVKCPAEITSCDEGRSWSAPVDVPTVRTETVSGIPLMFLAFSIGLKVLNGFG